MTANVRISRGSNPNQIKQHNIRAVLFYLLNHQPAFRVDIAEEMQLSTTTITNLIDELIETGLVVEQGVEETQGPRRIGRPRSALYLLEDARYAIGIQLGIGFYRIGLANLRAEILDYRQDSFPPGTPPAMVIPEIIRQVEALLAENNLDRQHILGVGVGMPGLVNHQTGVNVRAFKLGWQNVPIRDWFSEGLNLPVIVENNVKAMALGEAFFGSGRQASSLAFIYSRSGVGSGIVIDKRLLQGANLGAGEIGHMLLLNPGGKKCFCGQSGCLETLISEPALMEEAAEAASIYPNGVLASELQSAEYPLSNRLFAAARQGDPQAIEILGRAARHLGIALANLVNLLNPQMIVLGGLFVPGEDLLLEPTRETLRSCAFAGLGEKIDLRTTSFGWQAGLAGAASLVLTNLFYLDPEQI